MNTLKEYYDYRWKLVDKLLVMHARMQNRTSREILEAADSLGFKKIWDARQRCWKKIHNYEKQVELINEMERLMKKMHNN